MRPDAYAKFILTVIAICLVYLSLGGPKLIPTAQAQAEPMKVIVAGFEQDSSGYVRRLPLPVTIDK